MQKIILLLLTLAFTPFAFADNCPTVASIKSHATAGWKAYDSDDDTPLPSKRLHAFVKQIEQFALAEWKNNKTHHNTMHCYYRDKNGSALEAYLTKDGFSPVNNKNRWYKVSGSMHCAAGMDECLFQRKLATRQTSVTRS